MPLKKLVVSLLEGGIDGEAYKDALNYFYYLQIRAQGEVTTLSRTLGDFIQHRDVVPLLRALGYYPSQMQISELFQEMELLEHSDRITFPQFIRLYVNHRPAVCIGNDAIVEAFTILGGSKTDHSGISKDAMMIKLLTKGERMKEKELAVCLQSWALRTIKRVMKANV